jgi:hypothetical protein
MVSGFRPRYLRGIHHSFKLHLLVLYLPDYFVSLDWSCLSYIPFMVELY